jgi:glycolate oxidase
LFSLFQPCQGNNFCSYLFFEILETSLDIILQGLMDFVKIEDIDLEDDEIYVMESQKFHLLRKTLPRVVAEMVSSKKIVKKGTDVQVASELFAKLIERYQHFYQSGVSGILFGHFGDAHLHFNFFPKDVAEQLVVDHLLENF